MSRAARTAIFGEDREQIEVLVAAPDLEPDPGRTIRFEYQQAVTQYSVNEVRGRLVQHDQVDVPTKCFLEPFRQLERLTLERGLW